MHVLYLVVCGMAMGVAEIIPGVSGGTLAVVMNIYDDFVFAIGHFFEKVKKNILFLLPLVAGMGISILALSHVMSYLLEHFPMEMNFLFLGLLLGVVPMLFKRCTAEKFRPVNLVPFLILFAVMVAMAVVPLLMGHESTAAVLREMTVPTFFRFMGVGALAALCFILPGVSGSMMMTVFGIYASVITAIKELHFVMLLPVAVGGLCGLLFGARLIGYCIKRFPQGSHFAILGLVVGSAAPLIANSGFRLMTVHGAVSLAVMILGFVGAYLMSRLSKD